MVRVQVERLLFAEDVGGEPVQRPLRPGLDEDPGSGVEQGVQALHELHRRGDLAAEDVDHPLLRVRSGRVELAVDVGDDRDSGRGEPQPPQHRPQGLACRGDDLGVERVADRQLDRLVAMLLKAGDGAGDRLAGAPQDDLVGRVDVGEHHVARRGGEHLLDLLGRRHHGRHRARVGELEARHLPAAGADRLERLVERQRARRDQRPVLAEAVAHHEVRRDPVGLEQAGEGEVDGEHGRLGDLGPSQLLLRLGHRLRVVAIGEDDPAQLPAVEQRSHHLVGLREDLGHQRLDSAQLGEHVRVLRALAGVEEGDLARRPAAPEDAPRPQRLPDAGSVRLQRLQRRLGLRGQLAGVPVVDRQPLGRAQRRRVRGRRGGRAAGARPLEGGAERRGDRRLVGAAHDEGAAHGGLRLRDRRPRRRRPGRVPRQPRNGWTRHRPEPRSSPSRCR